MTTLFFLLNGMDQTVVYFLFKQKLCHSQTLALCVFYLKLYYFFIADSENICTCEMFLIHTNLVFGKIIFLALTIWSNDHMATAIFCMFQSSPIIDWPKDCYLTERRPVIPFPCHISPGNLFKDRYSGLIRILQRNRTNMIYFYIYLHFL